jgi:O-antigen ligase
MELKLILFNIAFLIGIPSLIIAGMVIRPFKNFIVFLMCFALCYPENTTINFLSRESYRMSTRGVELGLFDVCTIALFFILLFQQSRKNRFHWFPPLTAAFWLYVGAGLISWALAPSTQPIPREAVQMYAALGEEFYENFETGLYPLFEFIKQIRGWLAYLVVVNFLKDEKAFRTLINAIAMMVFIITIEALIGRYFYGKHRISATLGHPNSLGTFMGMTGTLMFGIALFRDTLLPSMLFGVATAASMVSVLLTISRGALAVLVMGLWVDVSSLFHRYLNLKNFIILFFGSLVALGLLFTAADTITARFLVQQDAVSDIEYRGLYNEEAKMMAADHPFGVGLGNFSAYSWIKYGPAVGLNEYGTQAHNLWFLTLGELGYPGLFTFIFFWICFAARALPFLFRRRKSLYYAAAASAAAAVFVGHIQFMLQLSYRQTTIYMFTNILLGVVMAACYRDRDTRRTEREERRAVRAKSKRTSA